MTGRNPIPEDKKREVMDLFNTGEYSRRQISEMTGIAAGSVSNIVKANGGSFTQTATLEAATKKHSLERKEKRGQLADRALNEAMDALERLHQPYILHQPDVKGNWHSHEVDYPPAKETELLMRTFKMAVETSLKLSIFDAESSTDKNISMLSRLDDQFKNMVNVQINNNYVDQSQDNPDANSPDIIIGEVEE